MNGIAGLLSILAGAWSAWNFGGSLSWWFGWTENYWLGPVLVFLGVYLTANAILGSALSVLQLAGGGLWTASPVRWLVGKFAFLLLVAGALWIIGLFLPFAGLSLRPVLASVLYGLAGNGEAVLREKLPPWLHDQLIWVDHDVGAFWAGWLLLVALWMAIQQIAPWEKPVVAYVTRPLRNLWRSMKTGVGGSASFMGLFDEWESALQWKPGRVMLGTSLYEPGARLGKWDDRHIITIATTRSGKGRSCIIPNLLTWPGSALVIDPKGENAAVTARARRELGQSVHIVDPFRLLERLGLDPGKFPRHRLNPLKEIALDDPEAVDQIRNLSAALVMIPPQGNTFWDESAMNILDGIIAHVMSSPLIADNERHLGTVRDYVTQTNKRKMSDLRESETVGGLAEKGYAFYRGASESASGDILTTLNVHMKWIDSPAMQDAMTESDFSFAELKHGDSTVYLVIPPEYLETHSRYLRLFITLALKAAGRGRKAQHAMLFIMDEFAALGALQVVATAAGVASGSGVKLWPIIQNLTQLRPYGDNWEVFLSNAGQRQIFAMNDRSTADYFSNELGEHIAWRKVRAERGYEWMPYGATLLRTKAELARESSRDSEKAVILFEGGDAALVRRAGYDRLFTKKEYDRNPYQIAPPLFSRAALRAEGGFGEWWGAVWDRAGDMIDPPSRRVARAERFQAWLESKAWFQRLENWGQERRQQKKLPKPGAGKDAAPALAPPKPALSLDPPAQELRRDKEADAAPEPAGEGAGPGFVADSEAAPSYAKEATEDRPQEPDAPVPPLFKPRKVPPVKKPRKPRAKQPPP